MTVYMEDWSQSYCSPSTEPHFPSHRHLSFGERNASPVLTCLSLHVWANYLYGLSVAPKADRLLSCPLEVMRATHVQLCARRKHVLKTLSAMLTGNCISQSKDHLHTWERVPSKTMHTNAVDIMCNMYVCVHRLCFLCSLRFGDDLINLIS